MPEGMAHLPQRSVSPFQKPRRHARLRPPLIARPKLLPALDPKSSLKLWYATTSQSTAKVHGPPTMHRESGSRQPRKATPRLRSNANTSISTGTRERLEPRTQTHTPQDDPPTPLISSARQVMAKSPSAPVLPTEDSGGHGVHDAAADVAAAALAAEEAGEHVSPTACRAEPIARTRNHRRTCFGEHGLCEGLGAISGVTLWGSAGVDRLGRAARVLCEGCSEVGARVGSTRLGSRRSRVRPVPFVQGCWCSPKQLGAARINSQTRKVSETLMIFEIRAL